MLCGIGVGVYVTDGVLVAVRFPSLCGLGPPPGWPSWPSVSCAALYSQLPICEAALAPISARAPGTARTSRYARALVSPIAYGFGLLPDGCGHHRAPDPRFCGEEVSGAIRQRLAAQAAGNVTGFADRGPGCLVIVQVAEVLGVVEQAVGQVVGGGGAGAGRRSQRQNAMSAARPSSAGIRTGRRTGGRPHRCATLPAPFHDTPHRKTKDGRGPVIWWVSGPVMCGQAHRRGLAGGWTAALPPACRPPPGSCCCR